MSVQKWSDDIWIAQVTNDPGFGEDVEYIMDQAPKSASMPNVIVDLSGIRHVNSSNLSQLLRLRKLATDSGSKLRIAAPPDAVWAVFLSTGLDKVFDFRSDTTTALADLQIDA